MTDVATEAAAATDIATDIALKLNADEYASMAKSAQQACDLLRGLAHEARLIILCMLSEGEKSVGELEAFLELRQPTVSQQLARLRADRLVVARRDGKTIYYSLASDEARQVIGVLYDLYCKDIAACKE